MRGMKGQWEQEIDWQRTHWGEVRPQQKLSGLRGTGQYEHREMAAAKANPVLLCVNESNIVEVRAFPPQRRPH